MSVYGGDSWAREAQYRKRRVDDLSVERLDASSYKKLSSDAYQGVKARHCVSKSRLQEKELAIQEEKKKRIALSECSASTTFARGASTAHRLVKKPLIEETRSEILSSKPSQQREVRDNSDVKSNKAHSMHGHLQPNNENSFLAIEAADNMVRQQAD